jgi:hypothetical protein
MSLQEKKDLPENPEKTRMMENPENPDLLEIPMPPKEERENKSREKSVKAENLERTSPSS